MSQVKISGNASGTGVFTVASPNSNNTQTLTLPDATATLVGDTATQTLTNKTLTTPTISGNANMTGGTKYQVGGVATNALAWVNFNGTTSPGTIRSQYNISSVTKNGTGDYTLNFTNALSDANYAVFGVSAAYISTVSYTYSLNPILASASTYTTKTTSAVRINDQYSGGVTDVFDANVIVFGN